MASRRLASSNTLSGGTKTNSASRSTKFFDEPRAGHSVDLDVLAGDPFHAILHSRCIRTRSPAVSVFGPMRNRPLPCMLDRRVRRQRGTKLSHGRKRLHPLPPSAEGREFRIHRLSFVRQSEGVRARQNVEVGKREIGPQQIILPVSQLAFQDLKAYLDLRKRVRNHFLVGRDAKLGKYAPFMGHVIDRSEEHTSELQS